MSARTPGPWTRPVVSVIAGADGTRICDMAAHNDSDVKEANAAFIVEAVNAHDELVAAVLAMEAFIRADDVPMPVSLIDQWRAAVAKAKGHNNEEAR